MTEEGGKITNESRTVFINHLINPLKQISQREHNTVASGPSDHNAACSAARFIYSDIQVNEDRILIMRDTFISFFMISHVKQTQQPEHPYRLN